MFDALIRGGTVVDGTGASAWEADVGIQDGRIASVGRLDRPRARLELDARGLVVAPGFVDIHAHSEFTLLADPRGSGKVRQGVTTEVCGNCGLSAAPLLGPAREHRQQDLAELGLTITWSSLPQYFDRLEAQGIAQNLCTYLGHGTLRTSVMGFENRAPTPKEMEAMASLVRQGMQEGAVGLSSGLIYPPGLFAETRELVFLAGEAAMAGGLYASHIRGEGDGLLEAVGEALQVGREARLPVQISHLKTAGSSNWGKLDSVFAAIEEAGSRGVDVACDRYPYAASSTDLDTLLPAWTYQDGAEATLACLRDPATRARIQREMVRSRSIEDWERVQVASVSTEKNRWCEGLRLSEIAAQGRKPPWDALLDLLEDESLKVTAIFFSMSDENLRRIYRKPYVMVGSDSSARCFDGPTAQGKPHPRGFGTFPRVLGAFVREEGLLGLEEAIHKMTLQPALRVGLADRGQIRAGFAADLVVFDPSRVEDRATYHAPYAEPVGVLHVLVNGVPVVRDGEQTRALPGRVLKASCHTRFHASA